MVSSLSAERECLQADCCDISLIGSDGTRLSKVSHPDANPLEHLALMPMSRDVSITVFVSVLRSTLNWEQHREAHRL